MSDQLRGMVERVTYYNEETGYSVVRLNVPGQRDLVTVVGNLPEVQPGESLRLEGDWTTHQQYGRQFKVERCEQVLPATVEGIKKYLGSGLVKGVGPVTAARIVQRFGADTLRVLDEEPRRLREALGVGRKRAAAIARAWEEQKHIREVMVFLSGHGVTTGLAVKIYKTYGDDALNVVQEDPYRLARDIWGVGFKTADKIARDLGLPPDAPSRVQAGVAYALSQQADEGHVYAPEPDLTQEAAELLDVPTELVADAIATLNAEEIVHRETLVYPPPLCPPRETGGMKGRATVREERAVYLAPFYYGEVGVTNRLRALVESPATRLLPFRSVDWDNLLRQVTRDSEIELSPQQQEAVRAALTHKVTVLTGGPGTGKCICGDALVWTECGLIPIKELMPVDDMSPGTASSISVQADTRSGPKEATHFYYGGRQKTLCVITSEKYEIEGTPNHKVVVATERGPEWRRLDETREGDHVAIYRPKPEYEFTFDPFAYFLGLFVGDGHAVKCAGKQPTGVMVTTADREIWEFLEQEMPKMNYTVNLREYSGRARMYYIGRHWWHGKGGIAAVMQEWGCKLVGSKEKRVPTAILRGTLSQQRSFLMGLFDADGAANKRDGYVELGMSNYQLLKTVQIMLLRFGITSVLKEKPKVASWRLTISGSDDAHLFYKRISFGIKRKQERRECLSDRPNTNRDLVPCLGSGLLYRYIAQTGKHNRKWWWKWKREVKGERQPHRNRVLSIVEECRVGSEEERFIRELCNPNIYWARVVSIKQSEAEVYDFHVPDGNEFVANGWINHNTFVVNTLVKTLEATSSQYALCAPTGRAAKRLAEATDRPAKTIHRLLEYSPQEGFRRNEENPLDVDCLIVDEASMLDLLLTNHLLKAVDPAAHVLFVGDVDQLPSVGAGDVLRDIIASGRAAVVRLTTIFRQAADSGIVVNAHRINRGEFPLLNEYADFYFFSKEDAEEAADLLVDIVQHRIPEKFGFDPLEDIQVLSPMYRGACGVANLNNRLQEALNPASPRKPERRLMGRAFRVGDRVMQTTNDYLKECYNGDIGRVKAIDPVEQTLTVVIDGRSVVYDWGEADELVHAFAVSVHKSQGSEYPAVVMPMLTQHYLLLQRNLFYTGVTRAKRLVVLVGTRRAIAIAVRNAKVRERHSGLSVRLREK